MLPPIVSELSSEPKVTERLDKIKAVCEQVCEEEISLEEFSNFCVQLSEELAVKANEILETVESTGYAKDAPQEVEAGFKGIDLYEQGLTKMILFIGEGNPDYLDEALEMLSQGNDYINEAMSLNRQARRNLDWEIWA